MLEKICFPALVIGKSSIDKIKYRYLVADKRYIPKAFRNVLIVDVNGRCFDTDGVTQSGGLSLFYSIRLIGYIVKVDPVLRQPVFTIDLSVLKKKIIDIITHNPAKFYQLSDTASLVDSVARCKSFEDIIDLF
jgi:hypothetical protein